MSTAGKLQRSFAPTQLLGAAIQASLWTLSVAQGPFYLARLAGFGGMSGSLATIVAVTILSWLYLSLPALSAECDAAFNSATAALAEILPYHRRPVAFARR